MESSVKTPKSIKRRTLVKGAAWAAPVIAVATATPLAAASTVEPEPSENATSVRVTTGSAITAGEWAQGEIQTIDTTTRPATPAVFPENTVITITAPEGATITLDTADRMGIGTIEGEGTSTVTITPVPGETTVSYYYTISIPGTATTQVTGDVNGSASGVFV